MLSWHPTVLSAALALSLSSLLSTQILFSSSILTFNSLLQHSPLSSFSASSLPPHFLSPSPSLSPPPPSLSPPPSYRAGSLSAPRGCAVVYISCNLRMSTCVYTCVARSELCPKSSCISRRSHPSTRRCVAKV